VNQAQQLPNSNYVLIGAIEGGIGGAIVLIVAIVVIAVVVTRRRAASAAFNSTYNNRDIPNAAVANPSFKGKYCEFFNNIQHQPHHLVMQTLLRNAMQSPTNLSQQLQ
jgi:hypothetical protein